MLSAEWILALFTLLALSAGIYLLSKRFRVPYTLLLVFIGLILVPLAQVPVIGQPFTFLAELRLTPELLFLFFLPMLIFESAFNMDIRKMLDNAWTITLLAVVGLLVSTGLIAGALYLLLPLVGIELPFTIALLFGAVISATDPVAVLSLFKEIGAPKRLSMIFEGESLFNDGTAVALFLVVLGIVQSGFDGVGTVVDGAGLFVQMVGLGIVFGLIMAGLFTVIVRAVRANPFVSATLLLVSSHIVFISSELVTEHGLFGLNIQISSIIATTIAALFLGNYARHTLTAVSEDYLGKVTEHFAFMANSLVFILAGLLFASSGIDFGSLIAPILITVIAVMVARAISVFVITRPIRLLRLERALPLSWELLLSWGSLRGALAIIVVLLIPESLQITSGDTVYVVRDLLLALTVGCILVTLFIKAPLIPYLIRKLHINDPEPLDRALNADLGIYYLLVAKSRLATHRTRGFVRETDFADLVTDLDKRLDTAASERFALISMHGKKLFEQSLHLIAINSEEHTVKQLYTNDEISESVYRKLISKLHLQREKIEAAQHDAIDPSKTTDQKDIFDALVRWLNRLARRTVTADTTLGKLQYYRAQMIMARKVSKSLAIMQKEAREGVFVPEIYDKVIARYDGYRAQNAAKVDQLLDQHADTLSPYLATLAARALDASGGRALEYLETRGLVDEHTEARIRDVYGGYARS